MYVDVTRLIWETVNYCIPRQNWLLESESSNSKIGCKRCSSFFENILARRESVATVNLLISLNKLYILLQCFNCRFQQVNTRCIIRSISRPTFSHLTFLVVIQILCLYLGDMREKYVWFSTILWISTKFTCNKVIAWTHCSSHFSNQLPKNCLYWT